MSEKHFNITNMGYKLYNVDEIIVLSHQIINMYGYVKKTDIDKMARLHLEKSTLSGTPLPITYGEWNPKELDYNKAFSTTERVLDYIKTYKPKPGDAELVQGIKDNFKRLVLKILGGTATPFQEKTAMLLNKKEVEHAFVGVICSWPYIVQKRKEREGKRSAMYEFIFSISTILRRIYG